MEKVAITVVGAGAVGLAVAFELSRSCQNIILLEKNDSFGQETSSRNSEVIHAGIYYPEGSLKARFCVQGRSLLYEFLDRYTLPYKRCGKYIMASEESEIRLLEILKKQAEKNGVTDLVFKSKNELEKALPGIKGVGALFSPSTGIFDTHKFMVKLESLIREKGVIVSYHSELISLKPDKDSYQVAVRDKNGETFEFSSRTVINCGGLYSDHIARMAGIDIDKAGYRLKYAKGEYFQFSGKYKGLFSSLLYPAISLESKSLGIHTVLDLQGKAKAGPNIHYVDNIDYEVDGSHREEFYLAVKRYLPGMKPEELAPDMAGIRPKLQGPGDDFRDFIIQEEKGKGLPALINLIGIESPGLTSCLAIAKYVRKLLD
ncbi:MAG: NAD(P)/FAD-dependent oxidoreductase [Spirochaetes bacterium]|nr:NAD(P)/FAD-dependent oxidoreductase [Spirochaetota bacterium]